MNTKLKSNIILIIYVFFTFNKIFSQTQIGQDINGEALGDQSGNSISLSTDGSIVAIGAPFNDGNGSNSGHVRIYKNISGNWVQQGSDIDGESIGDASGYSVSLSQDGSIVAIGAVDADVNGIIKGHVRVFQSINEHWIQIGQDIDGDVSGDISGVAVSLSSDGSIVAIGSLLLNNGNGNGRGRVRIYQNINTNWVQIGQDINGEAPGDQSGNSISLSTDGSIVAIGAKFNDGNGSINGHVRIYKNIDANWVQIGEDINGEAPGDISGFAVSLSSDGSIVAIGAPNNDGNGVLSGHVRIYKNDNDGWVKVGQDIDGEGVGDQSGYSLSISSNGSIVAIGATGIGNGSSSGHVKVYKNINDSWVQIGQDIDGESGGDLSGYSVSLSSDGSIVAIGAPNNDGNGSNSGHVRVYSLLEPCSILLSSLLATENQSIFCLAQITPITYNLTGTTNATITGLPLGVTSSINAGVLTISGTPTETGIFNYTITPDAPCSANTAAGTITVTGGLIKIGDVCYSDLSSAITSAQSGEVIDIYTNIVSTNITIPQNVTVEMDNASSWINTSQIINNGIIKLSGGYFENGVGGVYKGSGSFIGSFINNGIVNPGN